MRIRRGTRRGGRTRDGAAAGHGDARGRLALTRVSVAIQAHPRRSALAEKLAGVCLGGRAEIVYDPEPTGHPSPWRTYRRALELGVEARASHRLVLQDDVIVCDHFLRGVEAAAAARPGRVLAFFVAGHPLAHVRAVDYACQRGWSWAELDNTTWLPVVAAAWPTELIPRLLRYADAKFETKVWQPGFTADDEIAGRFLREAGLQALASVPSLVEHPDTVTSIASSGRRNAMGLDATRVAHLWIGDCGCDPRGIDWNLGPG